MLYTRITLVILHTPFGLIWTTPWPDAKELFLKFSKFRNSWNSQNSVWKPNFFLGTLFQSFFCFTLSLHCWYSIPSLVWFGQLLDPLKKNKILKKSQFARFAKFRMKTQFFLGALCQKIFCFTLSLHWWYSMPRLVWFGQLLNPMKKNKILKNLQFARFAKFRMKTQLFPGRALPKVFLLYTLITLVILHTAFGLIWTTP